MAAPDPPRSVDLGELIFPALSVVATIAYLWDVRDIPRPGENLLLVLPLGIIVLLLAGYLLLTTLGPWRPASADDARGARVFDRRSLLWMGTFALYLAALSRVDFLIATPVYLAALMYVLGVRSWRLGAATVVGVTFGCHVVFEQLLGVGLP